MTIAGRAELNKVLNRRDLLSRFLAIQPLWRSGFGCAGSTIGGQNRSAYSTIQPTSDKHMESHFETCVLWSGGKDCFLAFLHTAKETRTDFENYIFVTFVPAVGNFVCHPLHLLESHSRLLGIHHEFIVIDPADGAHSYAHAFSHLIQKYRIQRLISGDILSNYLDVDSYWLKVISNQLGLEFSAPLSDLFAEDIIDQIRVEHLEVLVTGVHDRFRKNAILGQKLSADLLHKVSLYYDSTFDLCGERGEYHTAVTRFGNVIFCDTDQAGAEPVKHGDIWALNWSPKWLNLKSPRIVPLQPDRGPQFHFANTPSTASIRLPWVGYGA